MTSPRFAASAAVIATAAALALASCQSSEPTPGSTGSAQTSSSPTPSATTPKATTPTPEAVATSAKPKTVASLKAALLGSADVPSGFSIDSSAASGPTPKSSSTDPKCAAFNELMNAEKAPGSTAEAHVSLDGGQNGPAIDESLSALGSTDAVAALTKKLQAAVQACPSIKLTMPTGESSKMKVTSVSAPQAGKSPVAARISATSGALEGFEMTMVWTGVDDVLLSMSFIGSVPDEIDGATQAAFEKAQKALVAGSATS